MSNNFKNILIIKPSSLGDIVMALPSLSALRRNFPNAKISWLVRPEFAQLLEGHPHLDEIIIFDRKFLGKAWHNPKALDALLKLIGKLRQHKFDAVIDFQGLFRTASLGWLSGCKKRFGMTTAREMAGFFYTHKTKRDQNCIHVVDYYLKIVQETGASDITVDFALPEPPQAQDSVNILLAENNIQPDNYAVFIPGSIHRSKCWPVERFAELADKISDKFSLSVVATGTASEKNDIDFLNSNTKIAVANLAGKTSLSKLAALLRNAKLVVCNDTGPGHIAVAVGVPLVMIFGPSNPIRLFPYKRPETLAAIEPFGRGLKLWSHDPSHAIEAITVEMVYKKVCEQIGQ